MTEASCIDDLPADLITNIMTRLPPSSTLVTRQVCRAFFITSPIPHSLCIEVAIESNGMPQNSSFLHPVTYPPSKFVRLRICMQQLGQVLDQPLSMRLITSLTDVLQRFSGDARLHALEMRGPLPSLLLGLMVLDSCHRLHQHVEAVELQTQMITDDQAGTQQQQLSAALGSLNSLKTLRLEQLSLNTFSLMRLTNIAVCNLTRIDGANLLSPERERDEMLGSLTRLTRLQTFDSCGPHNPQACKMLLCMTNLQSLTVFSTVRADILMRMPGLTYLHISCLPCEDLVLPALLHLNANRISDSQCLVLPMITPYLQRLEFRYCGRIGYLLSNLPPHVTSISPLAPLSTTCNVPCSITRLSLCLSCGHRPHILQGMPGLAHFTLAAADFRKADNAGNLQAYLAMLVSACPALVCLKLICFDLELAPPDLLGMTGLTCLELRGCVWSRAGLKAAVTSLPNLLSLQIRHCQGLSKADLLDVEHCSDGLQLRVDYEGRTPFCPSYRFA